jgi:hypothetical protein
MPTFDELLGIGPKARQFLARIDASLISWADENQKGELHLPMKTVDQQIILGLVMRLQSAGFKPAVHKLQSASGTAKLKAEKDKVVADVVAAYRRRRKGKVSHTAAMQRAAEDCGISERTAKRHLKSQGITAKTFF